MNSPFDPAVLGNTEETQSSIFEFAGATQQQRQAGVDIADSFTHASLLVFKVAHEHRESDDWRLHFFNAIQGAEKCAQTQGLRGSIYVLNLIMGALSKVRSHLVQTESDHHALIDWADFFSNFASGRTDAVAAGSVLEKLSQLSWFPQVPLTFSELIYARLAEDSVVLAKTAPVVEPTPATSPSIPQDTEVRSQNSSFFESAAADEFELLAEAFAQAAQEINETISQLEPINHAAAPALNQQNTISGWLEACESLADRFATATNAARFMGVASLEQALGLWAQQIGAFLTDPETLGEQQAGLLALIPSIWSEYFEKPSPETALSVIDLLREPIWAIAIPGDVLDSMSQRLGLVQLTSSRQVQARSAEFDLEDLSLEIPSEADQSVVDNLLLELPALTEQFTGLVASLCAGNRQDLEGAQRIAHTLKGSANTVGIRGVANLTHQLEDLFVIVGNNEVEIGSELGNFLSEAADCLEEMSEAVAGVGAAPNNSSQIYSQAIAWTNRLLNHDQEQEAEVSESGVDDDEESMFCDQEMGAGLESGDSPEALFEAPLDLALNQSALPVVETRFNPTAFEPITPAVTPTPVPESSTSEGTVPEADAQVRVPVALVEKLISLVSESSVLLARVQNQVDDINLTQRTVGDTASRLEELSHDLDRMVDSRSGLLLGRGKSGGSENFDELELDEYNEMHTMARRFAEIGSDSRVLDEQLRTNVLTLGAVTAEMERMQSQLRDLTLQTRMVPITSVSPRLQRAVRQAGRLTGKAVHLNLDGTETLVDNDVLARLVDPLMHLLRNAVDHGLETNAERIALQKPEIGQIYVSFFRSSGQLTIRCQDDGRGLDTKRIFEKALAKGLIAPGQVLDEHAITELILQPGFSTRDSATQLSGRGIGLDVVAQLVRELKGQIEIQHSPGAGTSFLLTLPLNFSSVAVMVAKASRFAFALSLRNVEQIVSTESLDLSGEQPQLIINDRRIAAKYLEDLVQFPREMSESIERVGLLVRNLRGQETAIIVPGLGQARNVISKPMSPWVAKIRGIDSLAALGDGSAAPIIDLPELLAGEGSQGRQTFVQAQIDSKPLCLVVDDSVSVRRSMESFVVDLGFDVVGARDGIEALAALENRNPVLVLADFEMPRMNGVELAKNIRVNPKISHVPVIMITSRSSDKHRNTALEAGVNVYLTKPYTEDDLAHHIYALAGSFISKPA